MPDRESREEGTVAFRISSPQASIAGWGYLGLLLSLVSVELAQGDAMGRRAMAASYEVQELRHTAFRAEDGAPSDITAMAQTADGFLWLATPSGLFRYDGARFDMELSKQLPSPSVSALLAEPDGALWIGYTLNGASVLRDGHLMNITAGRLPRGTVRQFFRSRDGTLWVSTTSGLGRLAGAEWQWVDDRMGYSRETPDWLGSRDGRLVVLTPSATFLYSPTSGRFERRPRAEGETARLGVPYGVVWRPDFESDHAQWPNMIMVDRTGSLWVSDHDNLLHYRWSSGADAPPREDRFVRERGLTGVPLSFFEDREGNIWVGTFNGLDRFSIPKLMRVVLPHPDNTFNLLLMPGERGDVWVGSAAYPIIRLEQGNQPIAVLGKHAQAAYRGADGTLWVGTDEGLFQYANGAVLRKLPLPIPEAPDLQAIAVDPDGAIWVSIAHTGLFHWDRDRWMKADESYRLPQGAPTRLLLDGHRRLWMGYPNDQVAIIEQDRTRVFTAADGLNVGHVLALDAEETHTWIAGDRGLGVLVGTRFLPLRGMGDVDFGLASGIVETVEGDLWLNAASGIYRIPSASVRSVLMGVSRLVGFEVFDSHDGLDSAAEILSPGPTALHTADGHLWFSRRAGLWWIDPLRIPRNQVAPIVSVEDLVCNGIRHKAGSDVSLPTGSRNLRIDYTAASLTNPERMQFRYRLLGVDEGWQEARQRRQAYYTNLSPGHYEFQVMAANEDGVWSTKSAVLQFNVSPTLYQRLPFKIGAGVMLILVLALLFLVRFEQVKRQYRRGVEARHAERERIARDIHDTLLQGVQALLFRLQMWEEDPKFPQCMRREIASVCHQTESMVIDGRERILNMRRADAQPADLIDSLELMGSEISVGNSAKFELQTVGEAKSLTADAQEQLIDIAREAVRNAYQHAAASRISVYLEYRKRSLYMSIADDGHGFDQAVADGRVKSTHFGLTGMRERARQLGGQFDIQTKAKTGTRVEVIVPATAAFCDDFKWPWQRRPETTG